MSNLKTTETLRFPTLLPESASQYFRDYVEQLACAAAKLDAQAFDQVAGWIEATIRARKTIYVCGNGGSAAISNHLSCDFGKGIRQGTLLKPKVVSLSAEISTFSAIANDIGYVEVFSFQLQSLLAEGDLVLAISSSGNSPNILRALEVAREKGVKSVLFCGFEGGRGTKSADASIFFPMKNYGIVEDLHQMSMHILAQYLRMRGLDISEDIARVTF